MSLKIGSIIEERYRITARIGHGGMSEVYEATDIINRKTVAIKMIREDVMKNPINFKRFQNEAAIAASLNHINIVKVFDHGTTNGRPFIVNEYISGQTLKDVLDFNTKLSISEALSVMIQLSAALAYAHSHGIVHRDVKPQNLYILADGTVKLGDFGIAEFQDVIKEETTRDIIGSVHYLAPEVASGKPATPQSDIYSAGVTFFELITGHVPFDGNSSVNIAVAHIRERFPSPKKYIPECPKEIEKVIFNCTNKSLKQRYKGASELYNDLMEIKSHPELLKEKKSWIARLFGFK